MHSGLQGSFSHTHITPYSSMEDFLRHVSIFSEDTQVKDKRSVEELLHLLEEPIPPSNTQSNSLPATASLHAESLGQDMPFTPISASNATLSPSPFQTTRSTYPSPSPSLTSHSVGYPHSPRLSFQPSLFQREASTVMSRHVSLAQPTSTDMTRRTIRRSLSADYSHGSSFMSRHDKMPSASPIMEDSYSTSQSNQMVSPDFRLRRVRVMRDYDAACFTCGIPLATLILHGNEESLSSPYTIEMYCLKCSHGNEQGQLDTLAFYASRGYKSKSSKKRHLQDMEGVDILTECDCCRRKFATGGVHEHAKNRFMLRDQDTPSFGVEVVCTSCRAKYGFCTECGGGNKFRTGKYRPLELFDVGRKTCKLSHSRIGKTESSFVAFDIQKDLQNYKCLHGKGCDGCTLEEVTQELRDLHFERSLFNYAVPIFMETVPMMNTWDGLNNYIFNEWKEMEKDLVETREDKRYYVAFALIDPPTPRRRTKSSPMSSMASPSQYSENKSQRKVFAGYVFGQWDLKQGSFTIQQRGNRAMGGDPHSMILEMSRYLISRLLKDENTTQTVQRWYASCPRRYMTLSTQEYSKCGDATKLIEDKEFTEADFSYARIGFQPTVRPSIDHSVDKTDSQWFWMGRKELMMSSWGTSILKMTIK